MGKNLKSSNNAPPPFAGKFGEGIGLALPFTAHDLLQSGHRYALSGSRLILESE